uniref:Uncharacterized protein n=1 Tax=Meloidogyne floridensis TaxID=298350 RepID=A0A915NMZ9_9BILA
MKDMKDLDINEIGLMEQIKTQSVKPPSPKKSNLTQDDMDLLRKLDVSKPGVGKKHERAVTHLTIPLNTGSMSLPRSLSPIQQQPKRAFSMDHKKDDETPDESEGSTEDDSNDSVIKEEAVEEQKQEEAVEEQNTVVEQKQSKNTCPRVSTPKIVCSLASTGVRPEMMQKATKECSDIIVDSGHLNEKDGKIYVENYEVEIMKGLKNIYSSVKFSNEKSEKLQGLINAQIKNAGLTSKIRGKKQSKGVQTRIDLIEAITKKQKYAQQYDGFILDLTGGFQNFSATFAEFLQDFLLALHSEKASGKPPKKQRRIFAIQLDSASKNFISTKESEKFLASLKYVDIVFVLNDISLADWLKSKNVACQKIILRSVDDGKGSCNRQSDSVNNNLRRKRYAQESRRVKSAPAILQPIREKKPPKSHTTWFESGEEEEEYGYNVETTAHFDNYPPKKTHRYAMRGSKGPHFKAAVKGQYPPYKQRPPQFYHKQKVGYGAPSKWKHSVYFGYDPNEHGSNEYGPNGHGPNGHGPNGHDSNEIDSEEYDDYGHEYEYSHPMEGRNKNNYQQTQRITTKMTMNINNHRKETNKNEAKRSRGTVRFNLENNINLGEEKENQNKMNEKSEKEKMEDTKAKEVSEQKEVKQEKEEVK